MKHHQPSCLASLLYTLMLYVVVSLTTAAWATSIESWNQQDIGTAAIPGYAIEQNGEITISGSGNDIWNSADDFYYVYFPVSGDASITVRVISIENTHPWAKAAVMFRETLDTGSINVALDYSAHERVAYQWRPVADQRSYYWARHIGPGPHYLKLERVGDQFTGYYSADGASWTTTITKTVPMNENIYLGLAASPHVPDQNAEAKFDSLSVASNNGENLCQAQGAMCGLIDDGNGGTYQCGYCATNSGCSNNQCSAIDETTIAAVCAQKGASCGPVRDGSGNTLSCGSCDTGESCSFNRCEASCGLAQVDDGPFDNLFAYAPLQFAYEDLSGNNHAVTTHLLPTDRSANTFPYESSVEMTDKYFNIDFSGQALTNPLTVAFKMMPTNSSQSATILKTGGMTVEEINGTLSATFDTASGPAYILNASDTLDHRSCNQVVLQIDNQQIRSYVNNHRVDLNTSALSGLSGAMEIGPYAGKVWDVRIYQSLLSETDITALSDDCGDQQNKPLPDAGFPNYLCGVYYCIYWPDGVTDTTQDSFEYQLSGHDMTWEHNVMETGMYKQGELCAEYDKPRDLLLTDGYRKSWVSKFNFEKPWNQYVLHENFHAYQSRTGGSTKFLAESSASWGAFSQKPTAYDTILGMYTLQPQLALWTTQSSVFEDGIIDYAKGGHQYGAAIWEWYVTHHVLNDDHFIGKVFNRNRLGLAPLSGKPSEGMYNALAEAGYDMREIFSDFAARVTTWDMDYADTFIASEIGSFNRMNNNNNNSDNPIPSEEVDNKIAEFYDVNGTGSTWLTVPSRYKIGDWAYNAYEVDVTSDKTYEVGINPSTDNPTYSEFRAQAVVYNEQTGARSYHKLPITTAGIPSSVMVHAKAGEKLYLVVSNTPSMKFDEFKAYTYDYLISPQ